MVCNLLQQILRFENVETLNPQHLAPCIGLLFCKFLLHNVTCPHKRKLLFSIFSQVTALERGHGRGECVREDGVKDVNKEGS